MSVWRWAGGVLFLLPLALLLVKMHRAFRASAAEFHRRRRQAGPVPADLPGAEPVEFPSLDGTRIQGWSVRSANRATVLLLHGSEADRRQLLPEARLLSAQGFGVLSFDWPGAGESGGQVTWGRAERAALLAAVGWLSRLSPEDRLGALGFSMGATILVPVAAEDSRLRALAVEGPVLDLDEQTNYEYRRWGFITCFPARLAKRFEGYDPSFPKPLDTVARLQGRPLLIIAGTADQIVPPANAGRLYAAAREPRDLWLVPGAHHGRYFEAAPGEYARRLIAFFQRALVVAR